MAEQQAQGAEQQGSAEQQGQQQQAAPPWGDAANFDPEKAWNLIQGLKADKEKLAARPVLDDESKQKLAEYDKFVEAQKTETQKAQEELARWQTDAEKWRGAAVASTVKALAAADFADPDDAVRNVDPAQYLDAGGTINEDAIKADLAKILEAKPHYRRAAEPQGPRPPRPNVHQGSGQGGRASADPAQEFATILQGALKQ
jgi:hypothetical protein